MPKRYRRNCDVCGQHYHGGGKRYCSVDCRDKCPRYRASYDKGRDAVRGKPSPFKGVRRPAHPRSLQALQTYYQTHQVWNKGTKGVMKRNAGTFTSDRVKGANNFNWKGGTSTESSRIRNSPEYKEWRMAVFQRDRFSCIMCGYRSHKPRDIRADHIKPFSLYPDLRFDVGNGRTLCLPCDLKHGWNDLRNSVENFNYAYTGTFFHPRIHFRRRLWQVLAPPRQ